ncbi:hypothetical protein [Haloactinopolyspora alba]|nr:hypothetical protein [Haloactinopolyspora alba]
MGRVKRVAAAIATTFAIMFAVAAPAAATTSTPDEPGMYCC